MKAKLLAGAIACLGLAACAADNGASQTDPVTQKLADRMAIEDLLVGYYSNFGGSDNEDFASYYTEDAVFDVNGIVSTGRDEIVAMYNGMGDDDAPADQNLAAQGVFHMLITNLQVDLEGDAATATMYWTGILNADPFGPPHLQEHGREYDQLVKQDDGSWLIKHRVVVADSAMPEMFRATYTPRRDFSFDNPTGASPESAGPETASPATSDPAMAEPDAGDTAAD